MEIIKGISFHEYYLTFIRLSTFLTELGGNSKKKTSKNRIILYDFYLRYPKLIEKDQSSEDYDTTYSYFKWKPNMMLYNSILADMISREIIINVDKNYYVTEKGEKFVNEMENDYINEVRKTSQFVKRNICKLSEKSIKNNIQTNLLNR